jgi:hypothetical protein
MTKITGYVVQERKSHTGGWKTISPKFGRSETARRWMKDHYRYEYHWFRVEPRRSAV